MSTESLDAYLSKRPHTIESAPALARLHGVDPKTVSARLRSLNYEKQGNGTWVYAPEEVVQSSPLLEALMQDAHLFTITPETLKQVFESLPKSKKHGVLTYGKGLASLLEDALVPHKDLVHYNMQLLLASLSWLHKHDILPIRAEITTSGFKPLTPQPQPTRADN